MNKIEKEFVPCEESLELKELGLDQYSCLGNFADDKNHTLFTNGNRPGKTNAPTFSQAINFLYICSNKQIDIELKASDTYEERVRKVAQGCEDLRNLQNSKSN